MQNFANRFSEFASDITRHLAGRIRRAQRNFTCPKKLAETPHNVFLRMRDDHLDILKRIPFQRTVLRLRNQHLVLPLFEWRRKRLRTDIRNRPGVHLHFGDE